MLHFLLVEHLDQRNNGTVGFSHAEEGPIAQRGENPTLHILDTVFYMGFIARFSNPRRQNRHMVILCQFLVAGIEFWFVAVGRFHARL